MIVMLDSLYAFLSADDDLDGTEDVRIVLSASDAARRALKQHQPGTGAKGGSFAAPLGVHPPTQKRACVACFERGGGEGGRWFRGETTQGCVESLRPGRIPFPRSSSGPGGTRSGTAPAAPAAASSSSSSSASSLNSSSDS